jgi:hypothetical protein
MLPSFAQQTITRIRPGIKTVRGSDLPDWDHASELVISGCSVQPAATDLSQDGRVLGILDGLTCYIPAGSDVREGDRIRFDGNVYTIDGVPRAWPSAGNLAHIQINIQRWSG